MGQFDFHRACAAKLIDEGLILKAPKHSGKTCAKNALTEPKRNDHLLDVFIICAWSERSQETPAR
jgi:hypothetical protein